MGEKSRPGIATLLIYLIGLSGAAGGVSGWVHASGAFAWLTSLEAPGWAPSYSLLNMFGLAVPLFTTIGLWIVQRCSPNSMRLAATVMIALLLLGLLGQVIAFFALRDVTLAFLIALALWIYALFAVWVAGRACKPAGVLMWVPYAWLSFLLVLGFELMRLNNGSSYAGGL